jgi:hypothetical protein
MRMCGTQASVVRTNSALPFQPSADRATLPLPRTDASRWGPFVSLSVIFGGDPFASLTHLPHTPSPPILEPVENKI